MANRIDEYISKINSKMGANKPDAYFQKAQNFLKARESMRETDIELEPSKVTQYYEKAKGFLETEGTKESNLEMQPSKLARPKDQEAPKLEWTPPQKEEFKITPEIESTKPAYEEYLKSPIKFTPKQRQEIKNAEKYNTKGILYQAIQSAKTGDINYSLGLEYYKALSGEPNRAEELEKVMQSDPNILNQQQTQYLKWKNNRGLISKFFKNSINGLASQIPMWTRSYLKGVKRGIGGAIAGGTAAAVGGQPELIPYASGAGFKVGTMHGMVENIAKLEAGHAYKEYIDMGIEPKLAGNMATAVGTVNGLLEYSQISNIFKMFGGAGNAVKNKVKKSALRKFGEVVASKAQVLAEESMEEGAQRFSTIIGGEISKEIQGGDLKKMTAPEIFKEVSDETLNGLVTFSLPVLMGIAGGTIQTMAKDSVNTVSQELPGLVNTKVGAEIAGAREPGEGVRLPGGEIVTEADKGIELEKEYISFKDTGEALEYGRSIAKDPIKVQELADERTVLLEEISELSPATQEAVNKAIDAQLLRKAHEEALKTAKPTTEPVVSLKDLKETPTLASHVLKNKKSHTKAVIKEAEKLQGKETKAQEIQKVRLMDIDNARNTYDETGTAIIAESEEYGIAVKDEGDFVAVRFGTKGLKPTGEYPQGTKSFATPDEAFAFAKNLQESIQKTQAPKAQGVSDTQIIAVRRGKIEKGGAYFSTEGTSTYYDPDAEGVDKYDIGNVKIVSAQTPEAVKVLKLALQDKSNTPKMIEEINESISEQDKNMQGYIDYHMNDGIPSIVRAAKKLGYDGIKVFESDDISDPSSVFIWNTNKVKNLKAQEKAPKDTKVVKPNTIQKTYYYDPLLEKMSVEAFGKKPEELKVSEFNEITSSYRGYSVFDEETFYKKISPHKETSTWENRTALGSDKNKQYITDGRYMIIDENIANTIRNKFWSDRLKKATKDLQKTTDMTFAQAQKRANEVVKSERSADENIPNYDQVIPKKTYKQTKPLEFIGFKSDIAPMAIYSTGKEFVNLSPSYVKMLKKYLPNMEIRATEKDEPVMLYVDKKLKGVLMPMRPDDKKPNLPMTKKGTTPSGTAFAEPISRDPEVVINTTTNLPELVRMAKDLMGSVPEIRNYMGKAIGRFYYMGTEGKIALRKDIFKKPGLPEKVLAHEIGHLVDWLPDHLMKRGNILGRLYTLTNFRKTILDDLNNEIIKTDLENLTQYWTPFDEDLNPEYTKYRYSAKELYADTISVLLNEPEKVKEIAPKFFEIWHEELGRKPEVEKAYKWLREQLTAPEEVKYARRSEEVQDMFRKGERLYAENIHQKLRMKKKLSFIIADSLIDKNMAMINKHREAVRLGKKINPEDDPVYFLEELNYVSGPITNYVEQVDNTFKILRDDGFTWEDIGEYVFHENIANSKEVVLDDNGVPKTVDKRIARPLGYTPETSKEMLNYIRRRMGENRYNKMKTQINAWHEQNKAIMEQCYEDGFLTEDQINLVRSNPKYATTQVLDYLKQYVTPSFIQQKGTFKESANPIEATTLKMMGTIRANFKNKVWRKVGDFLTQNFPEDIEKIRGYKTGKFFEFRAKPDRGLLKFKRNGKWEGYNVDPYIADTVGYTKIDVLDNMVKGLAFVNSRWFRPIFVGFNLGFQSYNLMRDFLRSVKANPHKSMLLSLIDTTKQYGKAIPHAMNRVRGVEDYLITEMRNNKILGMTYNNLIDMGDMTDFKEMEYISQRYGMTSKDTHKGILYPVKKIMSFIGDLSEVIETMPKVAGYTTLENRGIPIQERGHIVRNYWGSPDFRRFGRLGRAYNNVFLFSNAIKEGMRSTYEMAFSNPKTRSGYWYKTFWINIFPKLMMTLAGAGVYGEILKKMYDKIPEYDKTNYNCVPLWIDKEGNCVYLRLPQDEEGRIIGAMAHKIMNINKKNILRDFGDIFSVWGGQVPTFSPGITIANDILQFAQGKSPYDTWRGKPVFTDDEMKFIRTKGTIHGIPIWKFTKYELSKMGLGSLPIIGSKLRYYDQKKKPDLTPLQKMVREIPILSRYLRISKGGEKTREYEAKLQKDLPKIERRIKGIKPRKKRFKYR